jgi:glycerol-3-phosphate dehydrogenase
LDGPGLREPDRSRYDVLVVGGGIYGAAALYEAARRGLSAVLLERGDFGAATSSSSMKIVHGGLRYLQDFDLPRVLSSHRELRTLLGIAPHRVRPLHCELRLDGKGAVFAAKFRVGLLAHRVLSALAGPGHAPRVPTCPFPGWYDGIVDDTEQFLLEYLHTAVALGEGRVAVRNDCAVVDYIRDRGRIVGARTSALGEIACGAVIDCTGVASEKAAGLAMNLVVDPLELAPGDTAVGLPHPDGRFVFVVPWQGRCMIGTWEGDYRGDPAEPFRFDPAWIDAVLEWLAPAHPELAALSRESVRFVHAGLLPPDGRIRVRGVKYTMARANAATAVTRAVEARDLAGDASRSLPPLVNRGELLREATGGGAADDESRPTRDEILFAIDREQARTLSDVLLRRTSIATAGHPGYPTVNRVARVCAHRLGWSTDEQERQMEAFESDFRLARR